MSDLEYRVGGEQDTDRLIEDAVIAMVDELRALGLDNARIVSEVQARML